uniref:Uncharacterized protein n=1 Tax=Micrurus spixii TaxID=129469 RepID=A0A2D4N7V5_9SAUR
MIRRSLLPFHIPNPGLIFLYLFLTAWLVFYIIDTSIPHNTKKMLRLQKQCRKEQQRYVGRGLKHMMNSCRNRVCLVKEKGDGVGPPIFERLSQRRGRQPILQGTRGQDNGFKVIKGRSCLEWKGLLSEVVGAPTLEILKKRLSNHLPRMV